MRRGFGFHDRHSPLRFNPATLFLGGTIPGAFYDPSDLTTLFQDSSGVTPVTAAGQTVGLVLDKSKGLVLGSELGAALNSAGSWTAYGSNTVVGSGGEITITFVGGANAGFGAYVLTSILGLTVGRRYLFEFEVKINTGNATPYINDGITNISFPTSSTTYEKKSCRFLYNAASVIQINNNLSAGEVITFRNFSVREIAGNHAYQTVPASCPLLQQASGFSYLAFDGSNDSLLTSSVNFTGTDKMTVWAGLLKSSDAAQGVVAELSATIASNNGAFLLSAPNSAAANYNWSSKGTTQVDNTVTTYTAPNTAVLTGQANIAGPSNIIRVNGAQAGSVATTQGTGNFGNYPLYIGRRNNTTLPFNGRLYGLIVLGAAASDWQVYVTEQWMAGKTGLQF